MSGHSALYFVRGSRLSVPLLRFIKLELGTIVALEVKKQDDKGKAKSGPSLPCAASSAADMFAMSSWGGICAICIGYAIWVHGGSGGSSYFVGGGLPGIAVFANGANGGAAPGKGAGGGGSTPPRRLLNGAFASGIWPETGLPGWACEIRTQKCRRKLSL
jgi:hypothetical protein